ncbi:Uncharacterised protein [Mycobacteroides abscessus subsp. abscessus]|nr:Uncharacterised protein [Mycobacteroides abscessus subsp. abscessus]
MTSIIANIIMIINVMISTMNHFILKMATILIMMSVIIMIDTIKTITIETMIIMIQISIKQQTYTKN